MTSHATTPWPDDWSQADQLAAAAAQQRGGAAYGDLVAAQRLLQDRVAGAVLPPDLVVSVTARLTELGELLAAYQAPERERWDGWRPDLPGRAMPLVPPYMIDERASGRVRGRVTFTRFYLGGGAAAHGGAHTLLFDDVMGMLAGQAGGVARTAYLTVNYRQVTRLDVELTFEASLDSVDGRKRFISARLYDPDGQVLSDCTGLFLRLRPGQP